MSVVKSAWKGKNLFIENGVFKMNRNMEVHFL